MGRTGTRSSNSCPPLPCPGPSPTPWLVFPHEMKSKSKPKAVEKHTFCTITPSPSNNKSYLKSIPELRGKTALGCHYGWLLLIDRYMPQNDTRCLSLWNPSSFQTICLPPLHNELGTCVYASVLTSPPEDKSSFVLLSTSNTVAFCHPGDDAWIADTPRIDGWSKKDCFADLFVCNGVLYGRDWKHDLFVIEINSNMRLSFMLLELLETRAYYQSSPRMIRHMAECCGEVYKFRLCIDTRNERRVYEVEAWRLDLTQMAWVEVKSLRGHEFFICSRYCVSCHATSPESDSGGLYFVLPEDKTLYFYRVEDASVTPLIDFPNLKTPWGDPFWVLPRYPRLLLAHDEHSNEKSGEGNELCNLKNHQTRELSDVNHAENETEATILSQLPEHLITLIAKHLPTFDYLNFRSACKYLRAAAPLIKGPSTTSLKLQDHPSSLPFLMLLNHNKDYNLKNDDGDPFLWNIIDPIRLDVQYRMSFPNSFEGAIITYSNKGWLLAYENNHSLLFLNPFTGESGKYPHYEDRALFSGIGFSTTPTSPDCVSVGIFGTNEILIWYFQHKDETWNIHEFPRHEKGFSFPQSCNCPVYHDGAFFFLDTEGYLGVFEHKEEEHTWRVFDKVPMQSTSFYSSHIVECDGHIVVVFVGYMGKWVDVFRWNAQAEDWNKVESLGDQTIFINPCSCFSTRTRRPGMKNKIYFPRLNCGGVIFYSMETRNWHCFGSEEPLSGFRGTTEFLQCCWIDPSWFA